MIWKLFAKIQTVNVEVNKFSGIVANENVDENKCQILSAGRVKPILE